MYLFRKFNLMNKPNISLTLLIGILFSLSMPIASGQIASDADFDPYRQTGNVGVGAAADLTSSDPDQMNPLLNNCDRSSADKTQKKPLIDTANKLMANPGLDAETAKSELRRYLEPFDSIALNIKNCKVYSEHNRLKDERKVYLEMGKILPQVIDYHVRLNVRIDEIEKTLIPAVEWKKKRLLEIWSVIENRLSTASNAASGRDESRYQQALAGYKQSMTMGKTVQLSLKAFRNDFSEDRENNRTALSVAEKDRVIKLLQPFNPGMPGTVFLEGINDWSKVINEKYAAFLKVEGKYDQAAFPIKHGGLFDKIGDTKFYAFDEIHSAMTAELKGIEERRERYINRPFPDVIQQFHAPAESYDSRM